MTDAATRYGMARNDDHTDGDPGVGESGGRVHVSECGEEERPSLAVVRVVAAVTGTVPTRMRPLCEAVDPDALDQLFGAGPWRSDRSATGDVRFRFEGCAVTVSAAGPTVVTVAPDEPP